MSNGVKFMGDEPPAYYRKDMPAYAPLVGEWVRIRENSGYITVGLLELVDPYNCYLRPSLVNESINGEERIYKMPKEKPSIINCFQIADVQPITREHVDNIFNSGKNPNQLELNLGE